MSKILQYGCRPFLHQKNEAFRCIHKNHYDTLNLSKDCSKKDIRSAFLKLSKKHHPDRNVKTDSHAKYVEILEAYKVLSKPDSRHLYDLGLATPYNANNNIRYADTGVWTDDNIWQYRDKSQDKYYESKPYYGINGLKKISNSMIVLICLGIAAFGVTLQVIAIRHSFTLKRDELDKKSSELEELHTKIRLQALSNGDKKQIELLKQKLGYQENK